jgi:hypothetical protein
MTEATLGLAWRWLSGELEDALLVTELEAEDWTADDARSLLGALLRTLARAGRLPRSVRDQVAELGRATA